jgi:hypothetical protein
MIEPRGNKKQKSEIKRSKLVLLELNNNNNDLHVILFRNRRWNKFVTLGGRVDRTDNSFETALIREVREESFNLIDISDIIGVPNRIKYIDFRDKENNELVRVYFMLITSDLFDDRIYKTNRCILNNGTRDVPKSWTEIDDYDRFPIKNILDCSDCRSTEYFRCCNVRSELKRIYSPIFRYIAEANRLKIIDELIDTHHVVTEYVLTNNVSDTFLNGTSTIKIKN